MKFSLKILKCFSKINTHTYTQIYKLLKKTLLNSIKQLCVCMFINMICEEKRGRLNIY